MSIPSGSSSKLGYGCGGIWGMPYFPQQQANAAFVAALDCGIRFFDTGSSYSSGNAEVRLGRFLKTRGLCEDGNIRVGTKVGTHYSDKTRLMHKDYSRQAIIKSAERSRELLMRDSLDLLQLHGMPPLGSRDVAIDTLCELKNKGIATSIGVSCDGDDLLAAATDPRFDAVMTTYNVMHRSNSHAAGIAADSGKQVLIKSPMAHRLYSKSFYRIKSRQDVWYLLRALKNKRNYALLGRKYRFLTDALALSYACTPEFVTLAVCGSTRPENIRSNVEASKGAVPQELLERISALPHL